MRTKIFQTIIVLLTVSFSNYAQQVIIIDPISQLSAANEEYQMPKISPDGRLVAFSGTNYNGIFVIDYFGGEITQLTNYAAAGWNLKWSQNSDAIVTRVNFMGR
jgi:Tol biopolymer transport system component